MSKYWWQTYTLYAVSLVVGSLLVRCIFFYWFLADNPCRLMYDAGHYHYPAVSMSTGQGFTVHGQPYFYRMPGYSAFLAGCYRLFGIQVTYALIIQILLASCIPLLLFMLMRVMYPQQRGAALFAAVGAACHPGMMLFSGLVMTEALFLIFFLGYLLLFFYGLHRSWIWLLSAGVVLAGATYFRPIGHYVLFYSVIAMMMQDVPWKKKIVGAGAIFGGWLMVMIPWLFRNYLLTGYVFLHTLTGPHLMNHMAVRIVMQRDHVGWSQAREHVYGELSNRVTAIQLRQGRLPLEIEESWAAENLSMQAMWSAPLITGQLLVINIIKTCVSLYSAELLMIDGHGLLPGYEASRGFFDTLKRFLVPKVHNHWIIGFIYYELLFGLLMLCGLLYWLQVCWRSKQYEYNMLVSGGFMLLCIGLSAVCGFARLRLPIEPFILIYSCLGLYTYLQSNASSSL